MRMVKSLNKPNWKKRSERRKKFFLAGVAGIVLVGLGLVFFSVVKEPLLADFLGEGKTELEFNGNTIRVKKGGDLQSAINRARPGDTILLEAGAAYRGNFVLPRKEGNDFITIRSSAPDSQLPPANTRIDPKRYAAILPKILTTSSDPAIATAPGAHHYRFVAVEIASDTENYVYNLVRLGEETQQMNDVPRHFEFDRCYLHPSPKGKTRRGIALNNGDTVIKNSHIAGFAYPQEETQAIAGWSGPGPFKIINNYLEGGAENVLFGGAMAGKGMNPADLEFKYNYVTKPFEWRGKVTTKNLFELKDMRRALIEENVFENNWDGGQDGTAILLTPASFESGPDARVEDIIFRSNIIRRTANGITMTGTDYGDKKYPNLPVQNSRIRFENNFFGEISKKYSSSGGRFLLLTSGKGPNDLTFDRNTIENEGMLIYFDGGPHSNFIFTNNISNHNEYGVFSSGGGLGTSALQKYANRFTFKRNVVVGAQSSKYPADNFYIGALGNVNNFKGKATDGKDIGADMMMLREMEKKVIAGVR